MHWPIILTHGHFYYKSPNVRFVSDNDSASLIHNRLPSKNNNTLIMPTYNPKMLQIQTT